MYELYEGLKHGFVDYSSGVQRMSLSSWHVTDVAALDVQLRYHSSRIFGTILDI